MLKKEETPHQSPWWLTLLRLLMAALIVLALAEPIYNPRETLPPAARRWRWSSTMAGQVPRIGTSASPPPNG